MKAPFDAFFTLWQHLASLSSAKFSDSPLEFPGGKDGAVLKEGNNFKIATVDNAPLLVRFWLDLFQHEWLADRVGVPKSEQPVLDGFQYLLRTHPFPADGVFENGHIPRRRAEQPGAGQPSTKR